MRFAVSTLRQECERRYTPPGLVGASILQARTDHARREVDAARHQDDDDVERWARSLSIGQWAGSRDAAAL
jgi:hypothetical protein